MSEFEIQLLSFVRSFSSELTALYYILLVGAGVVVFFCNLRDFINKLRVKD